MNGAGETLLVFDLDGTLFQTEKVSYRAAVECFASFGMETPARERIVHWFGRPIHEFVAWVVTQAGDRASPEEVIREFSRLEFDLIREAGELFPGALEALEHFHADGCRLALCSNGSEDYVDLVTREMDIRRLFDRVSSRQGVDDFKSVRVAELKEWSGCRRGIVIGDREDDVLAARENGLLSLGCLFGYARQGELDEADELIRDSANLKAVIQQLIDEMERDEAAT